MDVAAYLSRIGYDGDPTPTLETLRAMHRAHAYTVPFENLDIAAGVRIQVDERVNFEKIVSKRRGGFCLELTGLFARALREIGFQLDVIGARVLFDGRLGQSMSHMTLIVHLDEDWIADVGFGGRLIEPLRLRETGDQIVDGRRYNVASDGDHWFVTCTEEGNPPGTYVFVMQPRAFDDFHDVCAWLQTSPDSRFTHGNIASLARPDGRVTLGGGRLIVVKDGERTEQPVSDDGAPLVLKQEFGMSL
jgi:N-hydroxyarylamine O-acetyltransferase